MTHVRWYFIPRRSDGKFPQLYRGKAPKIVWIDQPSLSNMKLERQGLNLRYKVSDYYDPIPCVIEGLTDCTMVQVEETISSIIINL